MTSEIKKAMDSQMASLHRDWRCQLHQHFKNVGGYVNLQVAKSHPHPDIIENEDWQWLCDYWSAKEQKVSFKHFIICFSDININLILHYYFFLLILYYHLRNWVREMH